MENKVVLGYWPVTGLGQAIRYLLSILHIKFEDKLYTDPAQWGKDKETLGAKFPNLPYLIDGASVVTESTAILRYIAKKNNREDLLGKTPEDYALVETYIGVLKDVWSEFTVLRTLEDPKAAVPGVYEKIKGRLGLIESNLKENSITGYLTIADLRLAASAPFLFVVFADHAQEYPKLQALVQHIEGLPEVKSYREHGVTQLFPAAILEKLKK
jgi:glutathione S-transferase